MSTADDPGGRHADGGTSDSATSGNDGDNGGRHRFERREEREPGFRAGNRLNEPHHPDGWQRGGR